MSLNEETELTIQNAADLLPTGSSEALGAEDESVISESTDGMASDVFGSEAGPDSTTSLEEEPPVVLGEEDILGVGQEQTPKVVESPYDRPGRWYVVHTQSGYEKKVSQNLLARIQSMHLQEQVHEVVIPMEDVVEFRNGRKVTVSKKMFPGYLLVRCHLDDISWSAIRDTPGIVNFVGAGGKPSPLGRREVETFLHVPDVDAPETPRKSRARFGFDMGETVRVKEGALADFSGEIIEINEDQLRVKVLVNIFGRETPVELEFSQVAQL